MASLVIVKNNKFNRRIYRSGPTSELKGNLDDHRRNKLIIL